VIEKYIVKEYDGTMESAQDLVNDMKLENHEYFLDVRTRSIYIHSLGMRFQPGDNYKVRLLPEFAAIDR